MTGKSSVTSALYGTTPSGQAVNEHTLTNSNGTVLKVIDYGATISHLIIADKNGKKRDVMLGFDTLEGWLSAANPCFNAVPGRCANRIARGKFTLDGKVYDQLAINNGPNHLHGGPTGFHKRVWTPLKSGLDGQGNPFVTLQYVSKDGEENYPGTVTVNVTYTMADKEDKVTCHFTGTTDAPTLLNVTNHAYINLSGCERPDILDHIAYINADTYVEVEEDLIPTGRLVPVDDTKAMSFLKPTPIGDRIHLTTEGKGYDHSYNLNTKGDVSKLAARITSPVSGLSIELYTNRPGVQLYCANWLDNTIPYKSTQGTGTYPAYGGFCLETQNHPDSINHPNFQAPILRPSETYDHVQIFDFKKE
eukprot:comp8309_c0_seq1/m.3708 comp8309_c0_seq1/g.3708  ORF comp8309_c0_seq1/g.3708 comp8309_c0_seq1/m.3708 type:complete len:362 (-) comp8309_c0_seq1:844-1929(-)